MQSQRDARSKDAHMNLCELIVANEPPASPVGTAFASEDDQLSVYRITRRVKFLRAWCSPRFTTDVNLGGVEKLSISKVRESMGLSPDFDITAAEVEDSCIGLLDPHQLVYVKGWSRCIACLCVLLCA